MNTKALIPLIAGLCVGGLALKLGLDYVKKAKAAEPTLATVWSAREDIPLGTALTEELLVGSKFPVQTLPAGAITDKTKLVGRVLRITAPAALPILEAMLLPPGAQPGIIVPEGLRAVAVKIDESSGVDHHLRPGCRVDVIALLTVRRNNSNDTIVKTLLENIEVGAVGEQISAVDTEPDDKKRRSRPARAVTLFVKPDQAPLLHMAEQRGKLKLSMRNDTESAAHVKTRVLDEADLFGGSPAKPDDNGGFGGLLKSLMDRAQANAAKSPPPAPVVEPPPPAPQPKQFEWTMTIWNGATQTVLGWYDRNSFEPVEVPAEGPNLFQNPPNIGGNIFQPPSSTPPARQTSPLPTNPPMTEPADDENPDSTTEPEELHG